MTRVECISISLPWFFWPFLLGSILLAALIARHNNLGLKDTLIAMAGLRKIKRTVWINVAHAGVLLIPFALVFWQLGLCDPTLFGA